MESALKNRLVHGRESRVAYAECFDLWLAAACQYQALALSGTGVSGLGGGLRGPTTGEAGFFCKRCVSGGLPSQFPQVSNAR